MIYYSCHLLLQPRDIFSSSVLPRINAVGTEPSAERSPGKLGDPVVTRATELPESGLPHGMTRFKLTLPPVAGRDLHHIAGDALV